MTIFTLVLYVAIAALPLTAAVAFFFKRKQDWLMSFLQNFAGILFIVSGYVKAVDPLGTAFKLEQYFAEFYYTFNESVFSFLAPMFPLLSDYSLGFSIFMIVFEIVLGIMLIIGARPKFTAWAFLLLVIFFTFLTGFTYLTGYVPSGVNFFQFAQWGPYVETNMRVTDCGCFGDFIKLKPQISFFKDIFLLFPAIFFVFRSKHKHQLFTPKIRSIIIWVSSALLLVFCLNNFLWNEPLHDFRPFKAGTDIRLIKQQEAEAEAARKITHYKMTNKATGQVVVLPFELYMQEFANYPKEEWNLEQIRTEPTIARSKISDFDLSGPDGLNVTEEVLNNPDYSFMVISYKLLLEGEKQGTTIVNDSVYVVDTIKVPGADTFFIDRKLKEVVPKEVNNMITTFDVKYEKRFSEKINPVLEEAEKAGFKIFGVVPPHDPAVISDLRHATQSPYPFYSADDLLLKTIMRSNPGLVLWKDGKIIQKWHVNKVPSFSEIQQKYMQ